MLHPRRRRTARRLQFAGSALAELTLIVVVLLPLRLGVAVPGTHFPGRFLEAAQWITRPVGDPGIWQRYHFTLIVPP